MHQLERRRATLLQLAEQTGVAETITAWSHPAELEQHGPFARSFDYSALVPALSISLARCPSWGSLRAQPTGRVGEGASSVCYHQAGRRRARNGQDDEPGTCCDASPLWLLAMAGRCLLMLGYNHGMLGVAAFGASTWYAEHVVHLPALGIGDLAMGVVVAAGSALAPDLDEHESLAGRANPIRTCPSSAVIARGRTRS